MTLDPELNMDLARKMVLGAETGAAEHLLKDLLRRHQRSWQRRLMDPHGARMLDAVQSPPPFEETVREIGWCGECDKQGIPCDTFILGSTLLGMVELVDGTRFSSDWKGPVEDRRY